MEILSTQVLFYQYSWWERVKICCFEQHFPFPVIYSDGLVSRRMEDLAQRSALGIKFEDYIIPLGFEKKLKPDDAKEYCKSFTFAGCKGVIPSWNLLDAIKREYPDINGMLLKLNGAMFKNAWYLSLGYSDVDKYSCIHFIHPDRTIYYPIDGSKLWVRPVFRSPI